MASIETIIKNQVALIPNGPFAFFHGEKDWQNLNADNAKFPIAYLDDPITSNDNYTQGGYVEETYPLSIIFGNKTDLDFRPEDHDAVIEAMRIAAKNLILLLKEDDDNVRFVTNTRRTNFINMLDVNISGCLLRFDIVPFNTGGCKVE